MSIIENNTFTILFILFGFMYYIIKKIKFCFAYVFVNFKYVMIVLCAGLPISLDCGRHSPSDQVHAGWCMPLELELCHWCGAQLFAMACLLQQGPACWSSCRAGHWTISVVPGVHHSHTVSCHFLQFSCFIRSNILHAENVQDDILL